MSQRGLGGAAVTVIFVALAIFVAVWIPTYFLSAVVASLSGDRFLSDDRPAVVAAATTVATLAVAMVYYLGDYRLFGPPHERVGTPLQRWLIRFSPALVVIAAALLFEESRFGGDVAAARTGNSFATQTLAQSPRGRDELLAIMRDGTAPADGRMTAAMRLLTTPAPPVAEIHALIREMQTTAHPQTRAFAAFAIDYLDGDSARDVLKLFLSDPDPDVQVAALQIAPSSRITADAALLDRLEELIATVGAADRRGPLARILYCGQGNAPRRAEYCRQN